VAFHRARSIQLATAKVEKPIYQLRENYTVVIVTHNMPSERQTEDYITG